LVMLRVLATELRASLLEQRAASIAGEGSRVPPSRLGSLGGFRRRNYHKLYRAHKRLLSHGTRYLHIGHDDGNTSD
jgi:hypothetical protein